PLLHAPGAFASVRLEKDVEIFPPVIVGDLLARLVLLHRAQDHLALDHVGFRVWTARVIGIAAHVAASCANDIARNCRLTHPLASAWHQYRFDWHIFVASNCVLSRLTSAKRHHIVVPMLSPKSARAAGTT